MFNHLWVEAALIQSFDWWEINKGISTPKHQGKMRI